VNDQWAGSDRRRHTRVDSNIPVKICHEEGNIVTETKNISRAGAYCQVSQYIAPMVKLKMDLLIPGAIKKKVQKENSTKKITVNGVVVRTEPVFGQNTYNIAIFFNEISQKDSQRIEDYVESQLNNVKK